MRSILRSYRRHKRNVWAFAIVAALTALVVALSLRQEGNAQVHTEQVLDCPVTGMVAHTHDESCYDSNGNLVCSLPERELHVHDDSCYAEERVLTCGLEEDEGHEHTDECYETVRTLVCGLDEITETHVHGAGCFETVTVDDGDDPATTDAGSTSAYTSSAAQEQDSTSAETHPAQTFRHQFKDADDNLVLKVEVEAPEGALPKDSTMVATWVDPATLSTKQQDAVDAAIAKKTEGQVLDMQAVDIMFRDASGAEVEPAKKVTVTLTSALISADDQALVVHIDDLTDAQMHQQEQAVRDGKSAEEAEPARKAEAVDALSDAELSRRDAALADDQLSFDSDKFSTYVLAVTSLHKVMQASDGATVTVTVDAPAEAGIPQDAELQVQELAAGSKKYVTYSERAAEALGASDGLTYARLFDISILVDGEKIQPAEPVSVQIELADAESDALSVVHFADDSDTGEVLGDVQVADQTVSFDASGFSIYVVADEGNYSRLVYRFHDADDTVISTQYVKKCIDPDTHETVYETLYDPGLVPEYGQRLVGWAYSADESDTSKIYQLIDLDNHIEERLDSGVYEDGDIVDVYAIMDDAWYLRYMDVDDNGNVKILKTERISKTAADKHVDINLVVELPDGVHYEGWYDPVLNQTYSEHLYEGEHDNFDTIDELNRHLDLYLKLNNRVWLVFDANAGGAGSGATYTPPQMMYTDVTPPETTEKPEDPARKGYTFIGWNTKPDGSGEDWLVVDSRTYDADGNLVSTQYSENKFGGEITDDVILYAQWAADDNFYRIAYWRQKETDSVDAPDSEKKYDFYGYREIYAGVKTGDTVSATNNDKNIIWVANQLGKAQGDESKFNFNATNSDTGSKTVAGDGSTVLNMYFDRAVMTFIFDQSFNWYTETTDTSGTLYGYVDGEYVELTKGELVTTYSYTMQYTYTAVTDNNTNRYGLIDGEYVSLARESYISVDNGASAYTGQRYNSTTNDSGTQYGVVDGRVVQLDRVNNGGCGGRYSWWYNGQPYNGNRYVQDNSGAYGFDAASDSMKEIETYYRYSHNNAPYTGTRYSRSNSTASYTGTRYSGINGTVVTGHTGQQYGVDANGGYVPLNRTSESAYSSFTYVDGEGVTQDYTGTLYNRGTTDRIRGLYGSQMKPGEWPTSTGGYWRFRNSNNSGNITLNAPWTSYTIASSAYEADGTTWHLYNTTLNNRDIVVKYWRQGTDGNYPTQDVVNAYLNNGTTLNLSDNKFYGFSKYGWRYGGTEGVPQPTSSAWHDIQGTQTDSLTGNTQNGTTLNIYYQRDKFNVTFQSNDASSHVRTYTEPVFYEKNLGFLKDWYTPTDSDGKDGYFFAGWYSDANFTKPFDFENETMPHNDIVLYGKWDTYRVRVALIPTKDNAHNDEVYFPNNQGLSFRVDYNETVSDANINAAVAERTGYKLVGWYTTPDFQDGTEWNFETHLNSRVAAVNMHYQESEDWENNTYGDNDGKHDNVEGILKLYAKWQFDFNDDDLFIEYEVPESYVKRDAQGKLLTVIPQDQTKYTYNADATSLTAEIEGPPENYLDAFTFDKWEVLDSGNTPTGVAFNAGDTASIADALPVIQIRQVTDDTGATRNMKVIVLRATFSKNNNNKGTVVTFDGNGGSTVDNGSETRKLNLLVNEDFNIPAESGDNAFEREGYDLIGWSFDAETTPEEFNDAVTEAGDDLQELAKQGMFETGTKVAADNLKLSDDNNWDPLENTIYAIWEPHKFTVKVTKLVDGEETSEREFAFSATVGEDSSEFELVNRQ